MKLQEINNGSELILEVDWGENKYEIETTAVGSNDEGLLIHPVTYNKKVLDLGGANDKDMVFNIHGIDPMTNSRIVWRNVQLKTIIYQGHLYYAAKTMKFNVNSSSSERRNHSRMQVDVDGVIELRGYEDGVPVHILDLSDSGISFTTTADIQIDKLPHLIRFEDEVKDDTFKLKMKCIWVRKAVVGDRVLWGCRISEVDKNVLAYICLKRLCLKAEII